jgi:mono/diheme cytochrome c family protein
MALIFALTVGVFFLLYLGPYRNPGWLSPGFAAALLMMGIAALSTGEFIREAVRKPYIVYNVVLGNQVLTDEVPKLRESGFLNGGTWTKAYLRANYPETVVNDRISGEPSVNGKALLRLPREDRIRLGELLFQNHCNDCHAAKVGYSAVAPLMRGRTPAMIRTMVDHLEQAHFFMPPWSGTDDEAELMTDYLVSIAPERPRGMMPQRLVTEVKP